MDILLSPSLWEKIWMISPWPLGSLPKLCLLRQAVLPALFTPGMEASTQETLKHQWMPQTLSHQKPGCFQGLCEASLQR